MTRNIISRGSLGAFGGDKAAIRKHFSRRQLPDKYAQSGPSRVRKGELEKPIVLPGGALKIEARKLPEVASNREENR
jgi:hypothetical protein